MTNHFWNDIRLEDPLCAEVDPHIFFPKKGDNKTSHMARAICKKCPELEPCRNFALTHKEIQYGIWGGLNMKEVRSLRARMRKYGKAA